MKSETNKTQAMKAPAKAPAKTTTAPKTAPKTAPAKPGTKTTKSCSRAGMSDSTKACR